jgi:hypothetical protein
MVEKAIEKYLANGGKAPYAVAFGVVIDASLPAVPPHVMSVTLPGLQMDSMAVMPLQTALDLVTATIYAMEGPDDDE